MQPDSGPSAEEYYEQGHRLEGRRTEIDFLNGTVAAKGEEVALPALTHTALTKAVKRVQRGEVEAHPWNVEKL